MSKVTHLASPRAGVRVQKRAQPPAPVTAPTVLRFERPPSPVQRQAAIENALSMALYFVRQPGESAANLGAALARANRALALLTQASQGNTSTSAAIGCNGV